MRKALAAWRRFWRGEESLGKAFWLWGVTANISIFVGYFYLWCFLLATGSAIERTLGSVSRAIVIPLGLVMFILPGVAFVYLLLSLIGGIRCARESESLWSWPAIVAGLLLTLAGCYVFWGYLDMVFFHHADD